MNSASLVLYGLPLLPLCALGLSLMPASRFEFSFAVTIAASLAYLLLGALSIAGVANGIVNCALYNQLFIDALSAWHVLVVGLIYVSATWYVRSYFKHDGHSSGAFVNKRFFPLWNAFFATMTVTLLSNNLGVLWVALEATTVVSAFLILNPAEKQSIEAMWKYLLVCSVGIAFAFAGTMLTSLAAHGLPAHRDLLFTTLTPAASQLNPALMLAAFIFIVVGFGTKAGLAPMHTWLPDAHSMAPTPVSAVFSGVLINCAMYSIMRYLPICQGALGDNQAHQLLMGFGLVSMGVAAVFIPAQRDIKRMLAYCSIEHMGIIAFGIGLGGVATVAALMQVLGHSLAKSLAFFSAGKMIQRAGTRDMQNLAGSLSYSPLWAVGFFVSLLVLIGMAPFLVFFSEFSILRVAAAHRLILPILFLIPAVIVFVSILKHGLTILAGEAPPCMAESRRSSFDERLIVVIMIALLTGLGFYMPPWLLSLLNHAAAVVNGGAPL